MRDAINDAARPRFGAGPRLADIGALNHRSNRKQNVRNAV
jgi:hypothetical protein